MIPVDQTTFGVPGGNCLSACVASLLELSIADVPYFEPERDDWYETRLQPWLREVGFCCVSFNWEDWVQKDLAPFLGHHLLSGRSRRGAHVVVARAGKMVHDPSPTKHGLVEINCLSLLVPLDPARVIGPLSTAQIAASVARGETPFRAVDRKVCSELEHALIVPGEQCGTCGRAFR